jgi:hypothetical protein
MPVSTRPLLLLASALFTVNAGCGQIQLPISLALEGDNTITLEVPFFPPGQNVFESSLVGGADATITVELDPFKLLTRDGLAALISLDLVRIAGTEINLFGLRTGTLCVYDDPDNPGGGIAYLRPLRSEADFEIAFNTLISPTSPQLIALFPDPLPFQATIDTTTTVTLADLIGLLFGTGGSGLELSQEIQTTLPEDIPFFANSLVTANLTLASADAIPSDPLLDECEAFLAGP